VWRWKLAGRRGKEGVWTKAPLGAPKDGRQPWALSVNRAEQQGRPYALAQAAVRRGEADGLGWLLQGETELVWLDLDRCRNAETGELAPWALVVIGRAHGAYVELTPSGTGVRIMGRAGSTN